MANRKSRLFTLEDYKNLQKEVHKANQRIERLTNAFGERSWATIGLYNKLEDKKVLGLTRYGYVRINKKMSDVRLKYIEQSVKQFNEENTTSTVRGAREAIRKTKDKLKAHFSKITEDDKGNLVTETLPEEDVGRLYTIVEDKDLRDMTQTFDPSETWARLIQAKEQNLSYDKFAELFSEDANINDEDVKEYLRYIYNLYMK